MLRRRRSLLAVLCVLVGGFLAYRYLWQPHILFSAAAFDDLRRGRMPFAWQSYIGAPLQAVAQTGKTNQTGLTTTNSYILVRLGWYLSPLGMVLGVAGLLRALWKRLNGGTAYFFAVLPSSARSSAPETFTDATYPYSLRRFLPVVIPGLMMLAAYALGWIGREAGRRGKRWRPRAAPAARLGGSRRALTLLPGHRLGDHQPHRGSRGGGPGHALAARFPDPAQTVLLFSNERDEPYVAATPLEYIFGINCFLAEPALRLGSTTASPMGRAALADAGLPGRRGARHERRQARPAGLHARALRRRGGPEWSYDVPELEQLDSQKPKNI